MWFDRSGWNTVACPLRGINPGLLSVHGLQADDRAPTKKSYFDSVPKKILFWFWFWSRAFKTTPTLHMHWYEAIEFLTVTAIDSEVFGYSLKEGAFHISFLNCLLCLGSGVIEFSTSRAVKWRLCLEVHINQVAASLCVSRPSLAGLQVTLLKTPNSKMLDPSRSPRILGVFHFRPLIAMVRYSSVGITTRYGLDGSGIESRWGQDFPHPSRPDLGPTQPPIQWVPGLPWG